MAININIGGTVDSRLRVPQVIARIPDITSTWQSSAYFNIYLYL